MAATAPTSCKAAGGEGGSDDTFVFTNDTSSSGDVDTILDFTSGDTIQLSGFTGVDDFSDLKGRIITTHGRETIIDLRDVGGGLIVLEYVAEGADYVLPVKGNRGSPLDDLEAFDSDFDEAVRRAGRIADRVNPGRRRTGVPSPRIRHARLDDFRMALAEPVHIVAFDIETR